MPETNKRIVHRIPSAALFATGQYYKPKTKVVAYARVSTGKDAMLQSLSAQISYYSNMIQQNDEWEFVAVYADEDFLRSKVPVRNQER